MINWADVRLGVNALSFCAEYAVVLYFFASLEGRSGKQKWLGYLCLALVALLYFQPNMLAGEVEAYSFSNLFIQGLRLLLYWAAVFGYLRFAKRVPASVCLYLGGFYTSFYTVARGLAAMGNYLCQSLPTLARREVVHRLWMTVVVLALEFLAAAIVHRFVHLEQIQTVGGARGGLVAMTNFLVLYFKYSVITLQSAEDYSVRLGDVLFYPLCAMGSVLAFLILFESFQAGQERQKALELEQMAQRFELRYVKRSTQAQADIRRIHHDMKNHLLAIRGMERHSQVSGYVDSLLHDLADYDTCVSTGLPSLDPFLSEKLYQAKLEQVQFNVCLDLRMLNFVAYTDLISIFGNAVDNALEAVRKLPPGTERTILLKSSCFANAVILRFGNPYTGKLYKEGNQLLTGKTDQAQHGIGLKSITRAVERYGGSVDVDANKEEKWFELTIMIPFS